MFPELQRLKDDLGLSDGQILDVARQIAGSDTLCTIDRLTASERQRLLAELRARECVGV